MRSGQLVSFCYVGIFIILPMLSNFFWGPADGSIYYYTNPPYWGIVIILLFGFIVASPLFNIRLKRNHHPVRQLRVMEAFIFKNRLKISILISLPIVLIYNPDAASFRYMSGGISQNGWSLIMILFLRPLASIMLLWLLVFSMRQGRRLNRVDHLTHWILVAVLLYTVNGTASFLSASFLGLFAASPTFFEKLVFVETDRTFLTKDLLTRSISLGLIIALFVVALMVGDSIKGTGRVGFASESVELSPVWLIVRFIDGVSSHYYALAQFFDQSVYGKLEHYEHPLRYVLGALEYRTGYILGYDVERPEIQSVSRLNFEVNSFKVSDTEGTSPGAVASFLYIAPFPVGLLIALVYLRWLTSTINNFFDTPGKRLSLFGALFVLLQFLFAYESPLDFLILADNATISIFTMWIFSKMGQDAKLRRNIQIGFTK